MNAKAGDIVQIDMGLEYPGNNRKYKAVVLWCGMNGQPLLTEVGEYKPHWGTYGEIAKIIDHVDLARAVNVLKGLGTKYINVVRCENCVDWEAPPENEQMDGNTTGFCRKKYGACYGQETDATWFCADGERKGTE